MEFNDTAQDWQTHGFVVLPGLIPIRELAPAVSELQLMFPSAEGFHGHSDARYARYLDDEFAGIDSFPFRSVQVSLLAVHARLVQLAELLLQDDDIRIYSAEAWAKYTGAARVRPGPASRLPEPHHPGPGSWARLSAAGDFPLPGRRARGAGAPASRVLHPHR